MTNNNNNKEQEEVKKKSNLTFHLNQAYSCDNLNVWCTALHIPIFDILLFYLYFISTSTNKYTHETWV